MPKKLPKGIRKFIRREKARIRRQALNTKEQQKLIDELYQKFLPQDVDVGDKKLGDNHEKS